MAFPHPQSRKDYDRNRNEPNNWGVVWKFFERAINIADDRNAEDKVDPAKNRTFGGVANHLIPFPLEFGACIYQFSSHGFWIVWPQKNKEGILVAVRALGR